MTVVEFSAPVETPVEVLTEREQRARTLEAAALELEVHGHAHCCKRPDGSMCMGGAILQAMGYEVAPAPTFSRAVRDLGPEGGWDVLDSIWGNDFESVAWWNDTEATPAEAVARLRSRAAEIRDGR